MYGNTCSTFERGIHTYIYNSSYSIRYTNFSYYKMTVGKNSFEINTAFFQFSLWMYIFQIFLFVRFVLILQYKKQFE